MSESIVLQCDGLTKHYSDGKLEVEVFNDIHFQLQQGEASAIVGASGSGKTTLLNLLAGLDLPSSGDVLLANRSWQSMPDKQRARMRNRELGFVYQMHHLLPEFSALENVMMPQLIAGVSTYLAKQKATTLLQRVGLGARTEHRPAHLSGGERQRVAVARALANDPACVLMDEPTGNLDEKTAMEIQLLIRELKQDLNMAFLIVTHDERMLDWMDTAYRLTLGSLQPIKPAPEGLHYP